MCSCIYVCMYTISVYLCVYHICAMNILYIYIIYHISYIIYRALSLRTPKGMGEGP